MIERRTVIEILDGAFALLREHAGLLLGVSIVYGGLPSAIQDLVFPDPVAPTEIVGAVLLSMVPGCFATYAVSWALLRIAREQPPTFSQAILAPLAALPRLLPVALLYSLLLFCGLLALVIPALLLAALLLPLFPVLAIEEADAVSSFGRAVRLGEQHRGRALGVVLCIALLGLPVMVLNAALLELPGLATVAVMGLAYAVLGAIGDSAAFLFYVDLRCRKEGLEIDHLVEQIQEAEEPDS